MIDKKQVERITRTIFNTLYKDKPKHNQCLRWSGILLYVIGRMYPVLDPLVQAGTAYWPYTRDNGSNNFMMGYELDRVELEKNIVRGLKDQTPNEWHVWVALRTTGEIIDITTAYQEEMFKTGGLNYSPSFVRWEDEYRLPSMVWTDESGIIEKGYVYRADLMASIIAHKLIEKVFREDFSLTNLGTRALELAFWRAINQVEVVQEDIAQGILNAFTKFQADQLDKKLTEG